MPIRWDSKILLFKAETVYGTDSGPVGANAILASGIVFSPMQGQDISRELDLPWLAAQATIPGGLHARMTFRVELVPSGTPGTPPAWGPLIRCCAVGQTIVADTSVVLNPISDNHEGGTLHFFVGTTRYVMLGSRGSVRLTFTAQGIAYLEFTILGLFTQPSNQSRPTPDLSDFLKPELVSKASTPTFEIDGTALVMRSFSLDLGNQVAPRLLVGAESIIIENRADAVACQIEAVPLATFNPYAKAASLDATVSVELVHGTTAGRIATLEIDEAQVQRPEGFENNQGQVEWPLRLTPLAVAGNDQWVLTLT